MAAFGIAGWMLLGGCGDEEPRPAEVPNPPEELRPPSEEPPPLPDPVPQPTTAATDPGGDEGDLPAEPSLPEPDPPATGIILGTGRIAVLDPGFHPTAVTTSHSGILDVSSMPPVLLLMGLEAGTSTLTVERAGGAEATWEIEVTAADRTPAGGPGLLPPGDPLRMPVGSAAVCTLPGAGSPARIDDKALQVLEFGPSRWFVQIDKPVHADLAFQVQRNKPPRVVSVVATRTEVVVPSFCVRPTESLQLVAGQEFEVDVGKRIGAVLVGSPDMVHLASIETAPNTLKLTGVRPGTTTLAVRTGDADAPYLRTLVVAPPP